MAEVEGFREWLLSLAGGKLRPATAGQYASLVKQVFTLVGHVPSEQELLKLGDANGALLKFQEDHSPTTIKNACISISRYALYLHSQKKVSPSSYTVLAATAKRWLYSLRRPVQARRVAMLEEQSVNIEAGRPWLTTQPVHGQQGQGHTSASMREDCLTETTTL